jgi:hypothetical protein
MPPLQIGKIQWEAQADFVYRDRFTVHSVRSMTNSPETTMKLEDRIEEAREAAHQAGEQFGKNSPEFAVAMETLEELHQESGHQRSAKPKNSLETYCSDNPDAPECLLYDT